MHEIQFSSLPILVAGVWVSAGFEGSAEVEIDETGSAYVDRITLEADGRGTKPLVLKPPRRGQDGDAVVMFRLIEAGLRHSYPDEFSAIEDAFDARRDHLGYGHLQAERL
jgi:hypothetical protein